MDFYKLPSNSKVLLDEIVNSNNPTELLCEKFKSASRQEDDVLRGIIRELSEHGYIKVTLWADNLPYHVVVNNSARTYNERLKEYEDSKAQLQIVDNSITIGDGNTIKNSSISVGNEKNESSKQSKKKFTDKHPILISTVIGLITGLVLMFSFWQKIVDWIEGLF